MKNSIWVCKNHNGNTFFSDKKLQVIDGRVTNKDETQVFWVGDLFLNFLGVTLGEWEITHLIYDTETGKIEVKRDREIGWYLTAGGEGYERAVAYHWNGVNWCRNRKDGCGVHKEDCMVVVSDKLPYNEYLRGLE